MGIKQLQSASQLRKVTAFVGTCRTYQIACNNIQKTIFGGEVVESIDDGLHVPSAVNGVMLKRLQVVGKYLN